MHCLIGIIASAFGKRRKKVHAAPSPAPSPPPQTAHVGALYTAFLAMMLTAGVPAVIAALSLGFMSNLFGSITHFGGLALGTALLVLH